MTVIDSFIPKFYFNFDKTLSDEELALIVPKVVDEPISLLIEDIIFLEENEPPAQAPSARQGFHTPKQVVHENNDHPESAQTKMIFEKQSYFPLKTTLFNEIAKQIQFQAQVTTPVSLQTQIVSKEVLKIIQALNKQNNKSTEKVLHPSLVKHHYQIAGHLLKQGYTDSYQAIKKNAKFLFNIMLGDLAEHMSDYIKSPLKSTLFKIESLLNTIELFAQHSGNVCYVPDLKPSATGSPTYTPLSLALKVYASLAPDHALMNKLKATANYIAKIDNSESQYLHAKYLLHRFPTGKIYDFAHNEGESIAFQSQGTYALFTTKMLKDSLVAFTNKLQAEQATELEQSVFNKLIDIFSQAALSCEKRVLSETADELHSLFLQDYTVLLPCGWQGHCVDLALSKLQSLYLFANSGEPSRYDDDSLSASGETFRYLNQPAKIDEAFFHDALINSHKYFEQTLIHKYNISEPVDIIEQPSQVYETCALDSHRAAVEGLLYIELRNQQVEPQQAKDLAKNFYHHWDNFTAGFIIDAYMQNKPSLPAQALLDIQHTLCEQEDNLASKLHLTKISAALENVSLDTHDASTTVAPFAPAPITYCPINSSLEVHIPVQEPIFAG